MFVSGAGRALSLSMSKVAVMTSNSDPNTGAKASSAALHGLRSSRRHDLPMTLSWLQDDLIGITRDAAATLLPELIVPTTGQDWRLFEIGRAHV